LAVLCARRRRLYQDQLQSTWDFLWNLPRPGGTLSSISQDRVGSAFTDVEVKRLVDALEKILAPFVVYGVARDLERLGPSKALFYAEHASLSDKKKADLLAKVLLRGTPSPSKPLAGYTVDDTVTPQAAYNRYFDWIIDPADVVGGGIGDSGVKVFYQRYPLLEHAVTTATKHYQHNIALAVERICDNWDDIAAAFLPAGATGVYLKKIVTTGNDFHKGGKQVLILTFGHSGGETRVVYKPSAVEIDCRVVGDSSVFRTVKPQGYTQDASLSEILNAATTQSTNVGFPRQPLPTYKILPYNRESVPDAYGYLEFLTHEPGIDVKADETNMATSVAAALRTLGRQSLQAPKVNDWVAMDTSESQSFYHQMGKIMAMALTVSLCDLHVQNLIVHRRQPHLIDVEEALKKPMTMLKATYLIGQATSPVGILSDPDAPELTLDGDQSSDMRIMGWSPPHRSPATSALYLWPDGADRPEPASLTPPVTPSPAGQVGFTQASWSAGLHRSALLLGFEEALEAFAMPAGNLAAQEWVRRLTSTVARYVTRGTAGYAGAGRDLYQACCEANADALAGPSRPTDGWYAKIFFKSDESRPWFVSAANGTRTGWPGQQGDPYWRPPYFALEHPDHVWYDYLNGDVPAFYRLLSDRALLNSRGETVSVGSAIRWQDDNLPGLTPLPDAWQKNNDWPDNVDPPYLPLSSVDVVLGQLRNLKDRWAKGDGERRGLIKEAFASTVLDPARQPGGQRNPRAGGGP
jgi:hypothetical protein